MIYGQVDDWMDGGWMGFVYVRWTMIDEWIGTHRTDQQDRHEMAAQKTCACTYRKSSSVNQLMYVMQQSPNKGLARQSHAACYQMVPDWFQVRLLMVSGLFQGGS